MSKFFRRFGLVAVASILLTYFLQYRYFNCDFSATWEFILTRPSVFWYNTLIMFFITLLLSSIFRRPWFGIGLTWSAISIITFINTSKMALRHNPLLPEDFQLADQAGSLTDFVDFWAIIRLAGACLLMLTACILLDHCTRAFFLPPEHKVKRSAYWRRHQLLPRLTLIAIAITGFLTSTDFIRHHTGEKFEAVPWLNTNFIAWNQISNFNENGFLMAFIYNFGKSEFTPPSDYNSDTVAQIATTYDEKATLANASLPSLSTQDYNIVVILNESFYDPSILHDYYPYEGEATPTWRSIQKKYPSGYMYSPDYGGGTANIEFEVLTSLSNYWTNTVPYTDILPKLDRVPSLASFAKDNGYKTTAIHPYNGGMYKRNYALRTEGIDTFITQDEMDYTDSDPGASYINDLSSYRQVLKVLNDSPEKQFVTLITMQNHAPFTCADSENHTVITSPDIDPDHRIPAECYIDTLRSSDAYLGEFLSNLDQSNEKTAVLFFGDHSPGVFDGVIQNSDPAVNELAHLTPYFIYANFDTPTISPVSITTPTSETALSTSGTALPTTTPNCLTNTFYDQLGIKKPSYIYLVSDVCTKYPILASSYFDGAQPDLSATLHNYELLNYDILFGSQHFLNPRN